MRVKEEDQMVCLESQGVLKIRRATRVGYKVALENERGKIVALELAEQMLIVLSKKRMKKSRDVRVL